MRVSLASRDASMVHHELSRARDAPPDPRVMDLVVHCLASQGVVIDAPSTVTRLGPQGFIVDAASDRLLVSMPSRDAISIEWAHATKRTKVSR